LLPISDTRREMRDEEPDEPREATGGSIANAARESRAKRYVKRLYASVVRPSVCSLRAGYGMIRY